MMGKFMLFKSFCWKKDVREAKWFMPGHQETGGVGVGGLGEAERPARLKDSERRHCVGPSQVQQDVRLDFKARGLRLSSSAT